MKKMDGYLLYYGILTLLGGILIFVNIFQILGNKYLSDEFLIIPIIILCMIIINYLFLRVIVYNIKHLNENRGGGNVGEGDVVDWIDVNWKKILKWLGIILLLFIISLVFNLTCSLK